MKTNVEFTLQALTQGLDASIKGDPNCIVTSIATIQNANKGQITFLSNPLYRKHLETTQASAVILGEEDSAYYQGNAVICRNPYLAFAKIAAHFIAESETTSGVHESCVIGQRVKIGPNVVIHPGCVIGDDVEIGEGSVIDANVTLYHGVKIGKRARLYSGVVIGGDGFGFANAKGVWHAVPQLGSVRLGDDVSVGANTTIDRGALDDTVIGNGVKLDNLIQVGHNTHIGDHTIIAGCVAIAGSTTIGAHCMIGGATCFAGHLTVCDHVVVTGMTAVTKSITEPGIYSSGIVGAVPNLEFRKNNARFHRLENLMQRVKDLEKRGNS